MSMASMTDCLVAAKRLIMRHNEEALDYNSMFVVADELSAFMAKYDEEMVGGLTTFYDVSIPYGQNRRGNDIKIKIKHPQLSILAGSTPSNLMRTLPEAAWDQGLMSRVIMVHGIDKVITDIFDAPIKVKPEEMQHDIKAINSLVGEFQVTQQYKDAINNWRKADEDFPPKPTHPKLRHYCARRLGHLLKLSMVAAVDRSNELLLTKEDFNHALGWLIEAEETMPSIFQAGAVGGDAKVMDEIYDFVRVANRGKGVPEWRIVNFAKDRMPSYSLLKVIEMMVRANMLRAIGRDPITNQGIFEAVLGFHQNQRPSIPGDKSSGHGGDSPDPPPSGLH